MDLFFQSLGQLLLYGGGAVAIAYGAFRLLATKWLDSKFAQQLEAFKHAQAQELKELEFRINALFDRRKRLHDREYEVVPEAWAKLNDAYWKAMAVVSPFQSYPDLERMSDPHLKAFVATCRLNDWEKQELLAAPKKNEYYQQHIFWHDIGAAKSATRECHVYLSKNGIFLSSDLKAKFQGIDDLVWSGLTDRETSEMVKPHVERSAAIDSLRNEGEGRLRELETVIQGRLHE